MAAETSAIAKARSLRVAAAYGGYRLLGSDLLPEMDEGGFILDYIMPAGSSLAETNDVLTGVERILRAAREVYGEVGPDATAEDGERFGAHRVDGAQVRRAAATRGEVGRPCACVR